MHTPLPGSGPVSLHHLTRELVRAEAESNGMVVQCNLGRAEQWAAYREHLLDWRYAVLRGRQPRYLQLCPFCGHVVQLEPSVLVCPMCSQRWMGANR